ncbi:MAG: radical SAM protein [Bacteriovoracaceae bacterium]|nr:radical SAM protein [Bacteriovoracaceae bacterium]
MRDKDKEQEIFNNKSTVYGPVKSWRFGMSLGIDPIYQTSTCSFNCFYCQLGQIQEVTDLIKEYVPTEKVLEDYKLVKDSGEVIDVITYSGSGEPTLAANIDEMIAGIKKLSPDVPQYILTNATELYRPEVRKRILDLDCITVKLDAADEDTFQKINRPASGVTLERVVTGIKALRNEYKGKLEVQSMFMPLNKKNLDDYAKLLSEIKPDLVQLNTPKRPYPSEWHRENRGNHHKIFDYNVTDLKTLNESEAKELEEYLKENTGLSFLSIYR